MCQIALRVHSGDPECLVSRFNSLGELPLDLSFKKIASLLQALPSSLGLHKLNRSINAGPDSKLKTTFLHSLTSDSLFRGLVFVNASTRKKSSILRTNHGKET